MLEIGIVFVILASFVMRSQGSDDWLFVFLVAIILLLYYISESIKTIAKAVENNRDNNDTDTRRILESLSSIRRAIHHD